jgi:hypothetical protein
LWLLLFVLAPCRGFAADRLVGIHCPLTISQSMPSIAEEAGLFRKYSFDFQLIYFSSPVWCLRPMLSASGDAGN